MKKLIVLCLMLSFLLAGCGSSKVIDGKEYGTYGLLNESKMKNDNVEYRMVIGNAIWGVFLCETIVAPVYFFGFSLYEPVGKKGEVIKGEVLK